MKLSWTEIAENPDQNHAFQEIVNQAHQFEVAASDYLGLGHLMISMAMNTMDYEDPQDCSRYLEQDAARDRKIRLANFVDYTCDYTERRLVLLRDGDQYLTRKMEVFAQSRKDMRVLQSFAEASAAKDADIESFMSAFEMLKDQLLIEGVNRKSLSKAFLDAGFVFARQRPLDEYISFCRHVSVTLDPERAKTRPLAPEIVYEKEAETPEDKPLSDMAFLQLEAASASIH